MPYTILMIKSFKSKALRAFWESGKAAKIDAALLARIERRLDAMDAATKPGDLAIPGFDFHPLRGKPQRYSVHVNGPWCLTFEWEGEDATQVDLENYH